MSRKRSLRKSITNIKVIMIKKKIKINPLILSLSKQVHRLRRIRQTQRIKWAHNLLRAVKNKITMQLLLIVRRQLKTISNLRSHQLKPSKKWVMQRKLRLLQLQPRLPSRLKIRRIIHRRIRLIVLPRIKQPWRPRNLIHLLNKSSPNNSSRHNRLNKFSNSSK